ncbi:hypothetical protein OIY81_2861 [Cryptosporidium canis]|nr:hypothetical protein OIY81_2861 [Cryptosporidium canis]
MDEDKEWSDSSYILRRRYRLNWSAIIRNAPHGLEGLHEKFSSWSVSLGFSLPDAVEELDDLCIQGGERSVYIVRFPSRSSTKSFIRLSKHNIWREISRGSYCELYVYCDPPFKMRPFSDFQTMNMATCYWLIRGVSSEIESEEAIWSILGRGNPYGEFLRRVVYIRDEKGSSGFCFLQFSSPLTSYRALKWELKQYERRPAQSRSYLAPEFIGTGQVKALLLLCRGLDKFENRTLQNVQGFVNHLVGQKEQSSKESTLQAEVLRGYLSYWRRSRCVPISVDKDLEFSYCFDDKYKSMYMEALSSSGIGHFPRDTRIFYCKYLNFIWGWSSCVFMDCQSGSLLEFDPELQSLKFIYNKSDEPAPGTCPKDLPPKEDSLAETRLSLEAIQKEREIRVASFVENARSQLSHSNSSNGIGLGCASSSAQDASQIPNDEYDSKRRKITQFFDTSSQAAQENQRDCLKPSPCILPSQNPTQKARPNSGMSACSPPAQCGVGGPPEVTWSVSDEVDVERVSGRVAGGGGKEVEGVEEAICFVCCREFGSVWERVRHEQASLLHRYNLEIWREGE